MRASFSDLLHQPVHRIDGIGLNPNVLVAVLLLVSLSFGCSSAGPRPHLGILTVAVAGDVVLVGHSISHGTSGTFHLTSLERSPNECKGRFEYGLAPRGRAKFKCSTGERGRVQIHSEGNVIGSGQGNSSFGPIQLVFGYSLKQVNRKLRFPGGQQLIEIGGTYLLVDR